MKTVLTHNYFLDDDPRERKIMKPYPPLGLLYIAAYLRRSRLAVSVFDSTFQTADDQREYILAEQPGVLGIYCNMMTKPLVINLIKWVRSQPSLNGCRIVLGGPDVSYNIENYLAAGADVAVIGEGEETMEEVVRATQLKNPFLDEIKGIAYYNALGEIRKTPARPKRKNIDELPVPARDLIEMERYLDTWKSNHGQSTVSVSTQRGCPYTCKWCSTAVYGQSYRRRSPEAVVQEMLLIQEQYKPDSLWFVDDVFTVSHKWLSGFVEAIKRSGIKQPFECITRADRMSLEVIALLKAAGCFRVWIGAESGSQKVIDAMDRRVNVQQVREMIRATRAEGLEAGTFIMLGYPGETEKDIQETINHLVQSEPHYYTITIAYPIKGTSLYEDVESDLIGTWDWEKTTDRELDFKRTYERKYYDWAVRWVVNEVESKRSLKRGWKKTPVRWTHKFKALCSKKIMAYYH